MSNVNTDYEKLAQEIYQKLNAVEGSIKNIDIQYNMKILGRSGCHHQIDVYWEFENMGETHKVAIECKNYNRDVSIGKLRDFFGVLHDIGDIKGIFIAKEGFQSGAIKFADYYNITLKEMRFPKGEDWNGRLRDLKTTINIVEKINIDAKPNLDMDWVFSNTALKEGDNIRIAGQTNELFITDEEGSVVTFISEIENNLPTDNIAEKIEHEHPFEKAFLNTPDGQKYKINSIKFTYDCVNTSLSSTTYKGDDIALAILKDVKSKKIKLFDNYGNIK